ncbi:MAG: hypothetical protein WDN23_05470 [Edaphobacter sp.]
MIDAMSERLSSFDPVSADGGTSFQLLTVEQLNRLERSEKLDTHVDNLFLLAETLGVSIAHMFWFVDLVLPKDGVAADPPVKRADALEDGVVAWKQAVKRICECSKGKLPITESEVTELYSATGLVSDFRLRDLLLRRFLRTPFPPDRFKIGIVGQRDLEMSPILEPCTILLIDTSKELTAPSDLCPLSAFYWGIHNGKYRCIWPLLRDDVVVYMTMDQEGAWSELHDALILGVPLFTNWQLAPLNLMDFYVADFRDQETERYIRALRIPHGDGLIH